MEPLPSKSDRCERDKATLICCPRLRRLSSWHDPAASPNRNNEERHYPLTRLIIGEQLPLDKGTR